MLAIIVALSLSLSGPADAGCVELTARGNVGPTVFYCSEVGQAGLLDASGDLVADAS